MTLSSQQVRQRAVLSICKCINQGACVRISCHSVSGEQTGSNHIQLQQIAFHVMSNLATAPYMCPNDYSKNLSSHSFCIEMTCWQPKKSVPVCVGAQASPQPAG